MPIRFHGHDRRARPSISYVLSIYYTLGNLLLGVLCKWKNLIIPGE